MSASTISVALQAQLSSPNDGRKPPKAGIDKKLKKRSEKHTRGKLNWLNRVSELRFLADAIETTTSQELVYSNCRSTPENGIIGN
jgi:hypothetical protein